MADAALTAARWDQEYRDERYANEPPVPFVSTIIDLLRDHPRIARGRGLYVGCGNGRNYIPLVRGGLDLCGVDVSLEALTRLVQREPASRGRLICADFRALESPRPLFDYLIAIQVFQHGDDAAVTTYFEKVAALLRPDGLLFLRANSVATEIHRAHAIVERNTWGGFTVRYEEGPKAGLLIHFYSAFELQERFSGAFTAVMPAREHVTVRPAPQTGSWAQWEAVWQRRAPATFGGGD